VSVEASLDLSNHIACITVRQIFVAVTPDPAFTDFMSSVKFTVISAGSVQLSQESGIPESHPRCRGARH
jgi:hypothetical protein